MQKTFCYNGRKYNVFPVQAFGETHELFLVVEHYGNNGTLAVQAMEIVEDNVEFWGLLTVNIAASDMFASEDDAQFLDTNNGSSWNVEEFLKTTALAEPAGPVAQSGYCQYPLYTFHTEKFYAD